MRLSSWQEAYEFARKRGNAPLDAERYADLHFPGAKPAGLTGVVSPFPDAVVEELHAEREDEEP